MSKSSLKQKVYKEIKAFYLIALYLWVVFSLFVLYKSVILAEEHISFALHGFAVINALAFAKVVLVARELHLGERFDDAPLIYPTVFKSAVFTILLACCKILEDAAVGHFHGVSRKHLRTGQWHLEGHSHSDVALVCGPDPFLWNR